MRFRRFLFLSLLVVAVAALWWQSRLTPQVIGSRAPATAGVHSPSIAPPAPSALEPVSSPPAAALVASPSVLDASTYARAWTASAAPAAPSLPPEFARFHAWSARFLAASSAAARAALESEGLDLARARRAALRTLIERDPRAALALAVPAALRPALPTVVLAELETRFSAVGDFTVLAFDYGPQELIRRKQLGLPTDHFQSTVQWPGSPEYRGYVYGRREGQTTKHAIPLHGIVLDDVAALHESAVRVLEPGETPLPTAGTALAAEIGGKVLSFATAEALLAAERKLSAAETGLGPRPIPALGTDTPSPIPASSEPGTRNAALPATAWTVGAKKILHLRVDFSDLPGEPKAGSTTYTPAYMQNLADTEVSPYFAASSYGKTSLTHTVSAAVYRLPQTAAAYATTGTGLNTQLHTDARTLAAAHYTLADYDRIVVIFSSLHAIAGSQITYGGLANVGGPYAWINGAFDFRVVAHELGHTWGLRHANLWKVTDGNPVSTAASAETAEYGDDFDTMGANFANSRSTDFNPWFKNLLGWIADSQVQTVATNGTFRVNRFDASAATGTLALKVVRDATRSYWIGLRRNFTANPSLSHGAYIVWGYNINTTSNLLDLTTPGVDVTDAALALNATLVDTSANLSLKPVAEGGTAPAEYLDVQINVGLNGFPVISAQPQSQGFAVGGTVALSVTATGTAPLTYQWTRAGADLPGATAATYTIANAQPYHAGSYAVRVSNSVGSVTSAAATLAVNALPVIDRPPGHVLALAGRSATFTVAASGFPAPTYQWRKAAVALSGATSATLTLANVQSADAGDYDVIVTNAIGSVTTPAVTLTVAATPTNDAFANALVLVGSAGTAHSSNLTATGETGEPQHNTGQPGATASSVWFRWTPTVSGLAQLDTLGTVLDTGLAVYTGSAVNALTKLKEDDDSGAPSGGGPSLLTLNVTAGTTYSIAVGSFDADPRGAILLNYIVHAPPAINTPPAAVAATLGGTAIFTVAATGWNLTYQWSRNGVALPGATAATLALGSLTAADVGTYTVAVTNPGGTTVSAAATLTGATAAATISSPPASVTITTGQTATFSVAATAPAGAVLAYQWRRNGLALPGATAATYSKSSATRLDADFYDVIVYADLTPLVSQTARLSVAPTVYPGFVAPDSAWDLQPEAVNAASGRAVAPLADGRAYVAGLFSSFNGTRRTSVARFAADGTLDLTFAPPEIDGLIHALAVQPDGKLVIGGEFLRVGPYLRPRVARLNADGTADPTFDPGAGAGTPVTALAVQSDGKILVAGGFTSFAGSNRHALVRLTADGSIDATFLTRSFTSISGGAAAVNALALQSDGRLLVGGDFTGHVTTSGTATARNCLVRLEGNGALDADFAPSLNANVAALLVQSDGRIVAGGSFTSASGTTVGRIARFLATGALDTAFATATAAGFSSLINTLTLLADGKILAGGSFSTFAGAVTSCLARLNSDGTRDTTFLTAGVNNTVIGSGLLSTGKILLAGSFANHTSTSPTTVANRARFARLNADGSLDSAVSFTVRCPGSINAIVAAPGGKTIITGFFTHLRGAAAPVGIARVNADGTLDATFNPGGAGANSNIYAAVLQPDGKLVISGFFTSYNGTTANRLARLTIDGTLDASFSAGSGLNASGYTLALLSAGRIFVGGSFTTAAGLARNRVAVFNSDGTPDSTFDPGTGANLTVYTSHVQADGKILIGGAFNSYNGTTAQRLARLLPTGALDASFVTTTGVNSDVYAIVAQPDGPIIIGGFFNAYGSVGRDGLARVSATGALDTTFVPPTLGPIYSLILQEDGRVIARGAFTSAGGAPGTAFLARFAADGTRDATFGAAGFGPSQFSQSALAVLRDNGQLVVQSSGSPGVAATQPAALPSINTQPLAPVAADAGTTVTLTVAATSALPLTYQWRRDGTAVPGATAATLALTTLSAANAGTYTVVITSELGSTTSEPVVVALSAPAAITSHPSALTVTAGSNATFSVVATGAPAPTYQWQRQAAGTTGFSSLANGGAYSGSTTATLIVAATTAAMHGDQFRCVVSNSAGSPVTSTSALLSVNSPPVITAQPVGRVVSPGATVTFGVTATGTPTLTYQWRRDGTALAGETNATFTRTNVQAADAGTYTVVVTNSVGSVTSGGAAIILIPPGTTASHTVTRGGYRAGGTATITNTFTYPAGTTSISLQVAQVAGWTLASIHGPAPTTGPAPGTANALEWTWTNPPANPLIFSYTLNVPAGYNFTVNTGVPVTFVINGVNIPLLAQPDPLVIRNAADKHSADTNGDNVISLFELTRVIELYNARTGTERTGRYLVATTPTEDGFAVDAFNSTAVLARHHRADTNTDGRLSLLELTRVIELYNTRTGTARTGAYRVAPTTTEDGFAPAP